MSAVFANDPAAAAAAVDEALVRAVIHLSPYHKTLLPLHGMIAPVALGNHQIRDALEKVAARAALHPGAPLRRPDLGPEAKLLLAFLEQIYFSSPAFLASVNEWPVGGQHG